MVFDKQYPLTSLFINFWKCYDALPEEFLAKAIPYVEYRGSFMLRNLMWQDKILFDQNAIAHLRQAHKVLFEQRDIRVYDWQVVAPDFKHVENATKLIFSYQLLNSRKLYQIKLDATRLTEAEEEQAYQRVKNLMVIGR